MKTLHHTVTLGDVAGVRQGHAFRGAIPNIPDGPVRVIQTKNLGPEGTHPEILLRTRLRRGKEPSWAEDGDVLLAGRGSSPVAVLLSRPSPNTLCSPHMYVIRVHDSTEVNPAFLAWQLNQRAVQLQLQRESVGTRQLSVRKHAVEQLNICLPSVELQRRIVAISDAAHIEEQHIKAIMQAREMEVTALTDRLLQRTAS